MNGPTAVDLDEVYLSPGLVDRLRDMQRRQAPELSAELDRAVVDVDRHLDVLARRLGTTVGGRFDWSRIDPWVRLQILDVWVRWQRGDVATCRHRPDPRRPSPVVVGLWRPDLVSCLVCGPGLLRLTGDADRTCDGCGRICQGPDVGDGIHPCAVTFGPILVQWGACRDCRPAWADRAPSSRSTSRKPRAPRARRRKSRR